MSKPAVVIRKLEDSPEWLDRTLLEAYWHTNYCLEQPSAFCLQPGQEVPLPVQYWLARRGFSGWAFLTAWNPRSMPLPEIENRRRNVLLADLLTREGLTFFPGLGQAGDWSEESFWIPGIGMDTAVRLGREFEQNALLFGADTGVVELWWLG